MTKSQVSAPRPAKSPYRIAVASMSSPGNAVETYGPIVSYLTKKLKRPTQLVLAHSYAELNEKVRLREALAAFVCSGGYVEGHSRFGMELVAVPQYNGRPTYYCYIISSARSAAKGLADFRGKRFAFTDRDSNTGCGIPTYQILKMGLSPESYFQEVIYTRNHDKSIAAVRTGVVDGAAVDNILYELAIRRDPLLKVQTKIVARYGPCAAPPVVVNPNADDEFKTSLKRILLNMHRDPEGRKILRDMMTDRFVPGADSAYDSIRVMRKEIEAWRNRPGAR
ncbi:MAG: phosphate/phosphite/phosphonate ABC transporter substrate-binding protein [Armatimonadota bacterium]|nr:phosphate/phosphite/phosphonate ABC transporter substrate-binding protein [Armatimonadota bacterium]